MNGALWEAGSCKRNVVGPLMGCNESARRVGLLVTMPYLNPPQKPSSRFSALNVFKLKSAGLSRSLVCVFVFTSLSDAAPPLPPKDASLVPPLYNRSLFSRSAASLVPSLSPESTSGPATPSSAGLEFGKRQHNFPTTNGRAAAPSPVPSASGGSLRSFGRPGGDYLTSPSMDGSTDSSGSCPVPSYNPNANLDNFLLNSAGSPTGQATTAGMKPKKSVFKLASLAKRNRSKKDLSDAASASGSASRSTSVSEYEAPSDGDEGISSPWNFQVRMASDSDNHPVSLCISHSTTYMSTRGECYVQSAFQH